MILVLSDKKIAEQRTLLNVIRDEKETAPLQVTISLGAVVVDCNSTSEKRMKDALDYWGSFDGETIAWVLADNTSLSVTQNQLQELYDSMLAERGARSLSLHAYATSLKAQLPVSDTSYMFDADLWDL